MRAVFFDLDGTLLDTVPDICAELNATLAEGGYPTLSEERTRAYVGNGARKLLERALPKGAEIEAPLAAFKRRYARCENGKTRAYEGIGALLEALKARGCALAVITNKPQEAAEHTLLQKFPAGTFDFIGGDSGDFPVKPDPALTRYAALSLRVAPRDCVFVGDGETDAATARAAGMRFCAALWGYRSREQLAAAGASEFAASPEELRKMLLGEEKIKKNS